MFISAFVKCKCNVRMMTDESYVDIKYMICPKCGEKIELDVIKMGPRNEDTALVNAVKRPTTCR